MGHLLTILDRVGSVTKRPPIWAVVGGALVARGGGRGRDAALRGGVAYGVAAVLANVVIKPVVGRRRPRGAEEHARVGPVTSSFPSGHAATDLAFVFAVSQRVPALFPPLAAATFTAHWSLVRSRAHHVSDILAGGALGIAVAVGVGLLWPGDHSDPDPESANDDERLMTQVDGEDARLLVHIEPAEGVTGAPSPATVTADPPSIERPS